SRSRALDARLGPVFPWLVSHPYRPPNQVGRGAYVIPLPSKARLGHSTAVTHHTFRRTPKGSGGAHIAATPWRTRVRAFLEHTEHRLHAAFVVLATTGMRRGNC